MLTLPLQQEYPERVGSSTRAAVLPKRIQGHQYASQPTGGIKTMLALKFFGFASPSLDQLTNVCWRAAIEQ